MRTAGMASGLLGPSGVSESTSARVAPLLSRRERRRALIRAKLIEGRLPRHLPAGSRQAPRDPVPGMRTGPSAGAVCSGCEDPIPPGEVMVDYTYRDGRVVVFHDECEMLWEEERWRSPEGPA